MDRRWRLARLALLALGCLALAWVFAKLGSERLEGELFTIDNTVRHWMLARRSPAGTVIFSAITLFGAKELLAPLGVFLGWWLFRDVKRLGVVLGFGALAAGEFVAVLKRNLHVMRPTGGKLAGLGYSFPSGHATGSMAIGVVLTYVAIRRRVYARRIAITSAIVVPLVGVSRVYLDVHWTSDVLGGWLVGAAFGAGVCSLYELFQPERPVTDAARSP